MEEKQDERKEVNLFDMLEDIRKDMGSSDMHIYDRLKHVLEKVDLSVLDCIQYESSSSAPKRRKILKSSFENTDGEHFMEEIKKQIEAVRNALIAIYDIENTSFKKFISQDRRTNSHLDSSVIFFRRLSEHAEALPLWVDMNGEAPPPLCGSIAAEENYVASVGDLVAANVKGDRWILAEVTACDPIKRKYTVDDIYEKSATEQILSWDNIIPLPKLRADPCNNPTAFFQPSETVLALYPGTTCFYHATVCRQPSNAEEPYTLIFIEDKYEQGVHQRFVIHDVYKGSHKVKE